MSVQGRCLAGAVLALHVAAASAQEKPDSPPGGEEKPAWEFNGSVYGYFPPDDRHYVQSTVIADHGAFHVEGRYNYEAFKTGPA